MDFGHLVGLLLDERHDPMKVGEVDAEIAAALGASTTDVLMSWATIDKQRRRHPELDAEHYRAIPMALALGEYRIEAVLKMAVLYTDVVAFNANFRVCIKATALGDEIWMTSFHKLRDRKLKQMRRGPMPLFREHR